MKAIPCKLVYGQGYEPCAADEATHLTIHIPGPSGKRTLPVQIHGRREGTGNWTWNGCTERPTLRPSVLSQGTNYLGGDPTDRANWPAFRCHTWITDGAAQYLDDCSHELRGQTVPLLDAVCDHEWETVDDSFDHEYGTERVVFERCKHCDAERPHEPYEGPEADQ